MFGIAGMAFIGLNRKMGLEIVKLSRVPARPG